MPLSNTFHLPVVLQFVMTLMPKRILDAGIGMGATGYMMRMYTDINSGRLARSSWQTWIEGIEVFEPYRNPIWDYAYDKVQLGDIKTVLPSLPNFDLVTCIDVLEHFEKDEVREIIRLFLEKAPVLIASTPNVEWPQGSVFDNEAEIHRCFLNASDFPHLVCAVRTGDTTCFVCCTDPKVSRALRRAALKMPIIRQRLWVKVALRIRQIWAR